MQAPKARWCVLLTDETVQWTNEPHILAHPPVHRHPLSWSSEPLLSITTSRTLFYSTAHRLHTSTTLTHPLPICNPTPRAGHRLSLSLVDGAWQPAIDSATPDAHFPRLDEPSAILCRLCSLFLFVRVFPFSVCLCTAVFPTPWHASFVRDFLFSVCHFRTMTVNLTSTPGRSVRLWVLSLLACVLHKRYY
jgi:hypothetical protein